MGQPKAMLPWGLTSLLAYVVTQLRLGGVGESIVVAGADALPVAETAMKAGAAVVVNDRWQEGRASSLRAGAALVPDDADPIVVLNVDQPRPAAVIRALLEAYAAQPALILVPMHEGRRGHPTLFAGRLLPELRAVRDEDEGLRAVLARHAGEVREAQVDSPLIHVDLNTPEDHEAALRLFEQEASVGGGRSMES